jgi:hypothetical protein
VKLYWGPHTCAIGIHILLEGIGEPYEMEKVDTAGRQTRQLETGFTILDPQLGRAPYVAGVASHFARMLTRPSERKVRELWGES